MPKDERSNLSDLLRGIGAKTPEEDKEALRKIRRRLASKEGLKGAGQRTPEQQALLKAAADWLATRKRKEEEEQEQELLDGAIRWLEEKWADQPCPYCHRAEWEVGTPLEIAVGSDELMSPAFPVMCGNCGHTTFVNAIRAGLLAEPDDE